MIVRVEELFRSSPAGPRLKWLLAGLDGRWPADVDAGLVLSPTFMAQVSPARFVSVMSERANTLAPIRIVGLDVESGEASARFRSAAGDLWVAKVSTEKESPYRIVSGYAHPLVPDYLTPGLASTFLKNSLLTGGGEPTSQGTVQVLTVFSGVPGAGKSTVADQVGRVLHTPVFALDWLLGALSPFGLRHRSDLMQIGEELLVTLAYRQLAAGASAIIDATVESSGSRRRFESLAGAFGVRFQAVVCVCSDRELHRRRVEQGRRDIPGWQDAGDWLDVEDRFTRFTPWEGSLQIDTASPLDSCVHNALTAIRPAT